MNSVEIRNDLLTDRVRKFTPKKVNHKIDEQTSERVTQLEKMSPNAIQKRLGDLDREWDIDRVLMLNFGILVSAQLFAARKNKKWLWGPLIQTPFMIMHATLGWCPPSLWFRPMGIRTKYEIRAEREALLAALGNKRAIS